MMKTNFLIIKIFYILNKLFYTFLLLFFINFFIIQILNFFEKENELILKYINEVHCFKENYEIWKKYYVITILSYFIIINLFIPIFILLIIFWTFFYILKFIRYKFSWDYLDFKIKKKDFETEYDISFILLINNSFLKIFKIIGFFITYLFLKFLYNKNTFINKNIYKYFKNILIIFMIGIGPNVIWFIQEISHYSLLFFTQEANNDISIINKIKIFLTYELFFILNQIMFNSKIIENCKNLRIYKSNWEIKFNPNTKDKIIKTSEAFKGFISNKVGKTVIATHPIYVDLPFKFKNNDKNLQTAIQFTSKPLEKMQVLEFEIKNYKQNTHFGVYNVIQQNNYLLYGYYKNLFPSMGINNIKLLENFTNKVWIARTVDKKSGIIVDRKNFNIENIEIIEKWIEYDKSFTENLININSKTKIFNINKNSLLIAEKFQKKFSSLSNEDQLIIFNEWSEEKTKIINYFENIKDSEFYELKEFSNWTKDIIKF